MEDGQYKLSVAFLLLTTGTQKTSSVDRQTQSVGPRFPVVRHKHKHEVAEVRRWAPHRPGLGAGDNYLPRCSRCGHKGNTQVRLMEVTGRDGWRKGA